MILLTVLLQSKLLSAAHLHKMSFLTFYIKADNKRQCFSDLIKEITGNCLVVPALWYNQQLDETTCLVSYSSVF